MTKDTKEALHEFKQVVNMTAKEMESWLETEQSQAVGQKENGGESIGHASGKRIIELLGMKQADYSEDDVSHMVKVVQYVRRHSAQRPKGDVKETHWRYSLMNWGHDPLKE